MPSFITLLTDFGTQDAYVATMKGVIVGIHPTATLIDISHDIPPQDLYAAAFILGASHSFFPRGTIHVVVVDPGVGTQRRALLLQSPEALFLAPDNGVLAYVLNAHAPVPSQRPTAGSRAAAPPAMQVSLPQALRAYAITNTQLFLPEVSRTFHGRDIYAPVAAHLSRGLPPEEVGPPIATVTSFNFPRPRRRSDGTLLGTVIHVDSFGNLITNLRAADLAGSGLQITVTGHPIQGLSPSYANGGDLLALIGSTGYLEIAARNGSAAQRLGIGRWTPVEVR